MVGEPGRVAFHPERLPDSLREHAGQRFAGDASPYAATRAGTELFASIANPSGRSMTASGYGHMRALRETQKSAMPRNGLSKANARPSRAATIASRRMTSAPVNVLPSKRLKTALPPSAGAMRDPTRAAGCRPSTLATSSDSSILTNGSAITETPE